MESQRHSQRTERIARNEDVEFSQEVADEDDREAQDRARRADEQQSKDSALQ